MQYINPQKLENTLNTRLAADIREHNLFGAALYVSQEGKTVYQNAMGVADPATGTPVSDKTLFRLASMTKPITAVAALILQERGKLSLDDQVSRYYPQFTNKNIATVDEDGLLHTVGPAVTPITLRHLLSHASGIGSGPVGALQTKAMTSKDRETVADTVAYFGQQDLSFDPGSKGEYSAFAAFDVMTGIIEQVAEDNFENYLQREVFAPCQMEDTTFSPTPAQWQRMTVMHDRVSGENQVSPMEPNCIFENYPCTHYLGGAGLASTLADYSHFANMLVQRGIYGGNRILTEASIKELETPQLSDTIPQGAYRRGLGVRVITDPNYPALPLGCYGWSGAYGPHFWIDPTNKIAAVYMKNSRHDPGSGSITGYHFEEDVYASIQE